MPLLRCIENNLLFTMLICYLDIGLAVELQQDFVSALCNLEAALSSAC